MADDGIRVAPHKLQDAANRVDGNATKLREAVDAVLGIFDEVGTNWTGEAHEQFTEFCQRWEKGATQVHNAIVGISALMQKAANHYEEADSKVAGLFRTERPADSSAPKPAPAAAPAAAAESPAKAADTGSSSPAFGSGSAASSTESAPRPTGTVFGAAAGDDTPKLPSSWGSNLPKPPEKAPGDASPSDAPKPFEA